MRTGLYLGRRVRLADPYRIAVRFYSTARRGIIGAGGSTLPRDVLDTIGTVASIGSGKGDGRRVLVEWADAATEENPSPGMWLDAGELDGVQGTFRL